VDGTRVWRELRGLVVERLDEYRREVAEVTGLSFSRVRALRRLRPGALTLGELAEAMLVDRPAATVTVDDLCSRGLAVRRAHPTDRRCKLVSLTDRGARLMELVDSVVPPPPPGWAELPSADLAALARVLDHLAARS
jgi:DNA-binding MarR family transcriptional regulator